MSTITEKIRETLRSSGLTQIELKEKTNVSQSIICDFLRGQTVNKISSYTGIAARLHKK